jgi:HlyD family secretion protein
MMSLVTRGRSFVQRRWKLSLLLAVLLLAAVASVARFTATGDAADATFLTAPLERAPIVSQVTSTGTLNALVTVEVSSQISGQVAELFADFNDTVKAGQPIARLDQSLLQAQVEETQGALVAAQARIPVQQAEIEQARNELERTRALGGVLDARLSLAESELAAAERELKRREELSGRGMTAAQELDDAETARQAALARLAEARAEMIVHEQEISIADAKLLKAEKVMLDAEAQVAEREASAKRARIELERAVIRSPIDGVVIGRDVDRGQTVAASLEAPTLFTIARDLREMEVHATVDEADIGRIDVDQGAWFTVDAYPERRFTARVTQIRKAPEEVENVVAYTVVLRTTNADLTLLPGMTALVNITVASTDTVLTAPNAALRYRPRGGLSAAGAGRGAADANPPASRVWIVDHDGRPRAVDVETGVRDERVTEIVAGDLREGQAVIIGEVAAPVEKTRAAGLRLGF